MNRRTAFALFFGLVIATPAFAHGEQVLLFPVGQLAGLVLVGVLATKLLSERLTWLIPMVVGITVGIAMWYLPGPANRMPFWGTAVGFFIWGLGPVLGAGLAAALVCRLGFKSNVT